MPTSSRQRGGRPLRRYELSLWMRSSRGKRLLQAEERELRQVLPELFGRSILQIGSWGRGGHLLAASEMLHRAVIGSIGPQGAQAVADPQVLPVQTQSVDAVLLPHTLEFAPSPHEVLREVDRILTDRGRLLILGFNPLSFWSLRERFGFSAEARLAGGRLNRLSRVCDWLELLGYEVTLLRRYGVGFPWVASFTVGDGFSFRRLLGPTMDAYLIVARKRVVRPTLVGRVARTPVLKLIPAVGAFGGAHATTPASGVDSRSQTE